MFIRIYLYIMLVCLGAIARSANGLLREVGHIKRKNL